MDTGRTTLAIQEYLDRLAGVRGDESPEPIVGELLSRSVERLQMLCASMLHRNYPRLTRGPTNLGADEMLGAIVERLIKALRQVHPQTVREFFSLANQHIRWELNDMARRLDEGAVTFELRDSLVPAVPTATPPDTTSFGAGSRMTQILKAIEALPDGEREAFNLVRIQGMTQPEAAAVIGVSARTVKRRLDRSLMLLSEKLCDLLPPPSGPHDQAGPAAAEPPPRA